MSAEKKAFYRFHASLMEPWDGPASIAFTDGTVIGAVLDRNGLRPSRYWVTDDGLVIMASEVGVLEVDPAERRQEGPARARPHVPRRHDAGPDRRRRGDQARARDRAARTRQWLDDGLVHLDDLPAATCSRRCTRRRCSSSDCSAGPRRSSASSSRRWRAPAPRRSARWAPTRRSPCSRTGPRLLFDYFQQLFAQVTNPPLDGIREELVTSLGSTIGPEGNLLDPAAGVVPPDRAAAPGPRQRGPGQAPLHRRGRRGRGLQARHDRRAVPGVRRRRRAPARRSSGSAGRSATRSPAARTSSSSRTATRPRSRRRSRACSSPRPCTTTSSGRRPAPASASSSRPARPARCTTWRCCSATAPPPSTRTSRSSRSTRCGTSCARVTSISPPARRPKNYIKAAGKGVLKVMSKMGISTVASYTGAQVFEAIGLSQELVDEYFTGTTTRLGGVGLDVLAAEVAAHHERAFPDRPDRAGAPRARGRRRVPVAARGRVPPVQPGHRLPAAARDPHEALRHLQAVHDDGRRAVPPPGDAARPVRAARRRAAADPDRRGRAGLRDRQAVLHRRDVLRLHLEGSPRDAGDRHEPHRREVEHRRGRRGRRPLTSPTPNGDLRRSAVKQVASGPLRRHERVPRQRRRPADQDGPGRQAGRGRPAARPQGVPVDRQDPALDAGRRPHQPAAAPRHLLDRGPRAAHPRPEELQPAGACT